ncbi:MAG TPA: RsmE family RNA methyltransferase, partial [bacterium]
MTFFRHHGPLAPGQTLSYTGPEADHLLKSRRMRPGDTCLLQDREGRRFRAEIVRVEKRGATLRIGEPQPVPPPPALRLTLLQAAVKDKAAGLIVQKATELGVAAIAF